MYTIGKRLVRGGTGIATFRGKHNALKGKTYLFLAQQRNSGRWFTARELHLILGLPLHSLRTHLKRWYDWGRILRRQRGVYEYRIALKGKDWLERWQMFMPLERWFEEIEAWQSKQQ
jgi:hypothetical protein